jgi:hypothetical protein
VPSAGLRAFARQPQHAGLDEMFMQDLDAGHVVDDGIQLILRAGGRIAGIVQREGVVDTRRVPYANRGHGLR